jgi:hypothetical protein
MTEDDRSIAPHQPHLDGPRGTSVGLDDEADLLRFSTAGSVDDG